MDNAHIKVALTAIMDSIVINSALPTTRLTIAKSCLANNLKEDHAPKRDV